MASVNDPLKSGTSTYTPPTEAMDKAEEGKAFVPALLVIDMQNDFVTGSLPVPGGASVVNNINELITLDGFKTKIATKDSHPDNHVSFAQTHGKPLGTTITIYHPEDTEELMGLQQVLWPVHCVASTDGADFVPGLVQDKFDRTFFKGTHPRVESYSAFRDAWGRDASELPVFLEERGVTDVVCVGLAGDYCVKYTAVDAVDFGFRTWVVVDCTKTISDDSIAWDELKARGVRFTTLAEVKKRVGS